MSNEPGLQMNRRHFFSRTSAGLGGAVLSNLMVGARNATADNTATGILGAPHFPAKAKRVIYLFQSGGPSQLETFDYKPLLKKMQGQELPDSVRQGQRLTNMSGNQSSLPLVGSASRFEKRGKCGTWVSDLLPHTAKIVDDLCIIKSMHTEAINHDPAITFFQTGHQIAGRPSIGAWLGYGLGSPNQNLPTFCVMLTKNKSGQPLYARLWGNGFLSAEHQGVQFRSGADPVLYLNDPPGIGREDRRQILDSLRELHQIQYDQALDPAINARIKQYEMAYRMQASVPDVADLSDEPDHIFDLYGAAARNPGSYAANCLMARRLVERGVPFVQLFHQGWDQHSGLPQYISTQCAETDQASAALVTDLKRRGMLDDTLVIWGGEFGRTNYSQGKLDGNFGRDHHPRCFSVWMAGGGVKGGISYGETDPFGYNIVHNPVHVHDFHATIMHLLGIDHERLTYRFQGRDYRLTDVHGHVVKEVIG